MTAAGIEVRGLTVEYSSGGYLARPLDGLDLDAAPGELVLLLGASGCGKTTLLSCLAGILSPTAGTIRLNGVDITRLRGGALVEHRRHTVGVVFQAFNLVPSLSAVENVMAPLLLAGTRRGDASRRARDLVELVGLGARSSHRPGALSGGEQQRVAIARALAHDPPVVLADEPTAHLDYIQVDAVLGLLRRLAGPGRVVVVATHDERLLPLADKVVELSRPAASAARPPERIALAPGQILFAQGEPGDRAYVVGDGRIEIVRRRADGGEEIVAVLGPGDYFGELAPLFGLRRSAGARAVGPTTVTAYTVADFRARAAGGTPAPAGAPARR